VDCFTTEALSQLLSGLKTEKPSALFKVQREATDPFVETYAGDLKSISKPF